MSYRFGLFEFDEEKLELRRNGSVIRLQAQPGRVLECLLQRSGEIVSRESLKAAIWGDETFVDFERGLNFCISQLRGALEDDAARPVYIRTFPKRGYQFIAPLERVDPLGATTIPEHSETRAAATSLRQRRWMAVAAAVVLVFACSIAAYRGLHAYRAKRPLIVAVVRFDNETGDPAVTRFSDGLTDNVVERLTAQSQGKFLVIGNSGILRLPRDQRDLKAIATTLRATYVVLGQVQSNGAQTRILAHLIRMPDQTHVWVVRRDSPPDEAGANQAVASQAGTDFYSLEADMAQRISDQFSIKLAADAQGASLPVFGSR